MGQTTVSSMLCNISKLLNDLPCSTNPLLCTLSFCACYNALYSTELMTELLRCKLSLILVVMSLLYQ